MTPLLRVLLVEDDPAHVELAMHAFTRNGYGDRAQVVGSGEEALEMVFGTNTGEHHLPDLIVLDLHLPGMDGLEVLKRLKGDARTRRVPVVVLTSSDDAGDLGAARELGANSYVLKPMDAARFATTLADLAEYWFRHNEPPAHGFKRSRHGEENPS
jgi:CheY-like chemotaxis protein